ncbi:hypothetical protein L7F22_036584 [Adiantum nelumboides]|nr:hypothetical protein [Adiantum nelumboides]
MDPRANLQEKKTMLINKCINLYCTEGLVVIDAYSNGFVLRCALKERREVMGLVESIKEREELHSELLSFATSDRQVKEWANIVEDLQTAAQDQQQAIESSTSETQLVLENKTPPSKPFDPRDDESKNMDEDQRKIVKELEGVQDNKAKLCNYLRDYQQNISGHDGEGPRGATEHQLEPMLLGTEVHEGTSSPTQPSSNLQADNCIFPSKFDLDAKDDNILMGELIPYLMQLDDAEDVRNIINSDRYGQLPVLYGHELFNLVSDVIEYWKEPDAKWSQKTLHLGKLPPTKQVQDIIDTKSSSTTLIDLLKLMQAAPRRWKGR